MGNVARARGHCPVGHGMLVRGLFDVCAVVGIVSIGTSALLRRRAKTYGSLPVQITHASGGVSSVGNFIDHGSAPRRYGRLHGRSVFAKEVFDSNQAQAGFILVSGVEVIALLMTAILVVACAQYVFKRKLRAQSQCVKEALSLQQNLGKTLDSLLRLNPRATRLRSQRDQADRALIEAMSTAFPPAVVAAKAVRTGVILQQLALQAQQLQLLTQAKLQRDSHHRTLSLDVRGLAASPVNSKAFYLRPLAVDPTPATSLSPDYETVADFKNSQRHEFNFNVDLSPPFSNFKFKQETFCSVTLTGKEGSWRPQIIAASAQSKRL